jgi:molecular chaperone GrpE (heat shock protein)
MKSYNQSLAENDNYKPYTDEEIEEMKETEIINHIRFKRLLATIDDLKKQ